MTNYTKRSDNQPNSIPSQRSNADRSIKDFIDIDRLRGLLEDFSQSAGFFVALVSRPDQETIISAGCRDLCARFHAGRPDDARCCAPGASCLPKPLDGQTAPGIQPCSLGLINGATPLIIGGDHLADIVAGQVFFQEPDIRRFKEQAQTHGFNPEEYLNALKEVPVVTESRLRKTLSFLADVSSMALEGGSNDSEIKENARTSGSETAGNLLGAPGAAGESLLKSKKRLFLALDASEVRVWELNLKTNSIFIDERFFENLGYGKEKESRRMRDLREITEPDALDEMDARIDACKRGKTPLYTQEFKVRSKNGQWRWINNMARVVEWDEDGTPRILIGTVKDITRRKRAHETKRTLEDQLRQVQKMESVGILAGGIAHDFNNILGAIFGYAQLAHMHAPENQKVQEYIDQILGASVRAKQLVRQILAFSRRGESRKVPADIGSVIKEALKLLRASLPATIEIRNSVDSNLGIAMADQTQIHQVVMNLCTNSAHAMPETGGLLEATLAPVELTEADAVSHVDLAPGYYLKLSISDNGCGIPPEILPRIFDPYFTTKEVDVGTGMGLAMVHGIVKDHGGSIMAYSEPGVGTSFQVFFPAARTGEELKPSPPEDVPGGSERILFVDDEHSLADVGEELLGDLGYKVESKTDAPDALAEFTAAPDKYDLIITDLTMPEMTGETLAREIQKIRPGIPIIICTGFSKSETPDLPPDTGVVAILRKPLSVRELAITIRDALNKN